MIEQRMREWRIQRIVSHFCTFRVSVFDAIQPSRHALSISKAQESTGVMEELNATARKNSRYFWDG